MNILIICSAKVWGGNEKWTSMAISALQEDHQVFFLGRNAQLHDKFGKTSGSYTAPFSWNFDLKTKRIIGDIVKKHHIDIILSTKKKEYFLAGLVARKYGLRHVIRLGIMRKMKIPFWSRLLYQKLNDGIIVNAQQIKKGLLEYSYFKNHPIEVIYNGIPETDIGMVIKPNAKKFTIVSTGMLTQRKGFHILIEAINNLTPEEKNTLEVHIIGEGREESTLKELVTKYQLEKQILFEGFSNQPTQFLSSAHLFALISGNEGISNAIIEAMIMGIPVLTTTAGGASEIITDNETGFITTRKVEEVTIALQEILQLDQKKLAFIGQQGQTKARSVFSLHRMNHQLEAFLVAK